MVGSFGLLEVFGTIVLIVIGIWYYLGSNYNHWKKLGIPGPEPELLYGNFKDIIFSKCFYGDIVKKICDQFPGAPMIGVYEIRAPRLILLDLDLIKDVLIKDFHNFTERGEPIFEKMEPLSAHLFSLETKRWRYLRPKLSPAFTSGKMKNMFTLMQECANHFENYLHDLANKGEPIDCREISAKFTTDVIGSCAFGLNLNALAHEDSEFRRMGRKIFEFDKKKKALLSLRAAAPRLYNLMGIPITEPKVTNYFVNTIKETLEHRSKINSKRGDLIDILNELKSDQPNTDIALTDTLLTSQAFVFFIAGFETSSNTISNTLYELAYRQDIQDKLRQEILETLETNNGNISYDNIKEMKYLHKVFEETLRIRPPVVILVRQTVNDYTFRGTNITIPKGEIIFIPTWCIHHNPEYYPNPEVYDPERFSEENIKARNPMTYLPFGDGPRNCIGARFAVYQTKLGLIKILSNFKVEPASTTQYPFVANPVGILLQPVGGIHLKFTKVK